MIEEVDRQRVLRQLTFREKGKEELDAEGNYCSDQTGDKYAPQKIDKVDTFSFANIKPVENN